MSVDNSKSWNTNWITEAIYPLNRDSHANKLTGQCKTWRSWMTKALRVPMLTREIPKKGFVHHFAKNR
jgi:hypothetical protein